SGRTQEIQRLIGRSLRAVTDLTTLGEVQITVDCDVLQADGGTRTASICGGYVALHDACSRLVGAGSMGAHPLTDQCAAISVGIVAVKLVLATANPDKAAEIRAVLLDAGVAVELVPRPDDVPEVEEDGATLEDNARLKAVVLCAATGLPAVADDTGLEVDALG